MYPKHFTNNSVINIQQSRFLPNLMLGWYYNINKANLPTKWTVCLPNPVINHHLDRIIIINLTWSMSERRSGRRELAGPDRFHTSCGDYNMYQINITLDLPSHIPRVPRAVLPITISFFFDNK